MVNDCKNKEQNLSILPVLNSWTKLLCSNL